MHWESLGFKSDPLSTDPINQATLGLYIGHNQEISKCQNVLNQKNILLIDIFNADCRSLSFVWSGSIRFRRKLW